MLFGELGVGDEVERALGEEGGGRGKGGTRNEERNLAGGGLCFGGGADDIMGDGCESLWDW